MKILHIITRLILGGAQQNTVLTCAAQVRAGHSVCLVYGPIYGPEGSLLDDALASGAQVICVPSLRRAVLPPHDVRCYRALRSLIRKIRPDVVHTHSSKAGILGRAAAWREKVPAVIHTIHGLPFHDRQSCIERGLYVAAERWAARRCHRIVGVTRAMCDAFADHRIGRPQQRSRAGAGAAAAVQEPGTGQSPVSADTAGAGLPLPWLALSRNGRRGLLCARRPHHHGPQRHPDCWRDACVC